MNTHHSGVSRLDLYLAAGMRPSKDLAARLQRAGVPQPILASVSAAAKEAGLGDPTKLTRDMVVRFFGPGGEEEGDRVVYPSNLWPEHRYEWHISEWGHASHGGFRLVEPVELPTWLPRELGPVSEALRAWFHTANDVTEVMGEPDLDLSWGPAWGWYYGPLDDGTDLVFDFDFGLLREVRAEKSAVKEHRAGGQSE